ncbi:cytochrome P450 [Mycobacterium sp.]|uniref:cytochrome P450 n=1 Tax=Mycobacterium sp. TaxID=1785 RepID=UPI003D131B49
MANAIDIGGVDLSDPQTYRAGVPHEAFRRLREQAPVVWHPGQQGPGFYALTGYDEIHEVSRDSTTWSSEVGGVTLEAPGDGGVDSRGVLMLTMDPPRHTTLRALISRGFTPRQVTTLHERIADMARDVVDSVIERGHCDFANDVAGALPAHVIAEMLGTPLEDGRRLYALIERMNRGSATDPDVLNAAMEMFAYAGELAACKREQPGDDIATSLLQAEVDGQRLTDVEFNYFVLLLINAGGDTTRNLVAGGMCVLMDHPEDLAMLAAEPSMLATAVEELLRYVTPVNTFARLATKDAELHGVSIRRGERVAMFYPSGNRDDSRFAEPDRFDMRRTPNPHLGFGGGGTHFCLGANLARVEATALLREVLARMENLELAGPPERTASTTMNGLHTMPVRFTPTATG